MVAATTVTVDANSVAFACDGSATMSFDTREDQCAHIDATANLGSFSLCPGTNDG